LARSKYGSQSSCRGGQAIRHASCGSHSAGIR
jgi:hypothetical protein